jgi:hypothetical protein
MMPRVLQRRWIEKALIVLGVACLGWYGIASATSARFQRQQRVALTRALERERSAQGDLQPALRSRRRSRETCWASSTYHASDCR